MNKFSFRSLRWKLTGTYTLVTTAALLTAGALALAFMIAVIQPRQLLSQAVTGAASGWAAMEPVQTALAQTPPDAASVQATFSTIPARYKHPALEASMLESQNGDTPGGLLVVVTDRQGRIVATLPPLADASLVGTPLTGPLASLASTVLTTGQPYSDEPAPGRLFIAQPVLSDESESVLGSVIVTANMNTLARQSILLVLGLAGGALLIFALLAGLVGTLFGFLATRGFTRRLSNLAQASADWRKGNFSASVPDTSGDEIGQLATDLNFMAADLRALFETRQELAAIEERNRLARDLHDSIKQQAFAISAQINAARSMLERDPSAAGVRLEEAEALSNQLRQELSALVRELYSADVLGQGLPSALRELASTWARQNSVPVEVEAPPAIESLPEPIALALYRVAQEALSNIARHAGAKQVRLSLQQETDRLMLQIQDDGCGFDEQAIQPGLGLRSMSERLASLGGDFHMQSAPGQGTTVCVSLENRNKP
jgi:two-component system, NarL family, sensor histidine kinase LiaS